MFLLRSAFWLTVGFMLVAPHGTDFGGTATALTEQAVETGIAASQQLVVSQLARTAPPPLPSQPLAALETTFLAADTASLPALPRPRPASLS